MSRRGPAGEGEGPGLVYGVHPVCELLERRAAEVERIFVLRRGGTRLGRILRTAREAGIPVSHLPREVLARKVGRGATHQGVAAQVAAFPYAVADDLCRAAAGREGALLMLIDGVEDAGNLGAILRSAAGAGVDGVLLSTERTTGLTPGAAKASAGALERVSVAREPHPARRLRDLGRRGFSAILLDPRGDRDWDRPDLRGRVVLVVGGESAGARPGVRRECNSRVAIPLQAGIESLNVAVAASVLLFEVVRQRRRALERSGGRC